MVVNMSKKINIGFFGLGTIGVGVLKILRNSKIFQDRTGLDLSVTKAVVSNINKDRGIDLTGIELSNDPSFILEDESIDIVIELIGDLIVSEKVIIESLKAGKSILTANKAVIARKAEAIFDAAYSASSFFGFEASVGSGIPVIRSIREGFAGDTISKISGIFNSTSNYILTKMYENREDFNVSLKDAQEKGLAEPDPTFDIEGYDAAHKLIVLMNLSFNKLFNYDDLFVEGISNIQSMDIKFADEMGYKVKHIGWAENSEGNYYGAVHPLLVKKSATLSTVNNAFNAIKVETENGGPFVLNGLGAGSKEAASGVISDLVEAARFISTNQEIGIFPLSIKKELLVKEKIEPFEDNSFKYYLRFMVDDKPGVLGELTTLLGKHKVSISSVIQKESDNESSVPIVIITHLAKEKDLNSAITEISKSSFIKDETVKIRIK